jgi:hypothetical protein
MRPADGLDCALRLRQRAAAHQAGQVPDGEHGIIATHRQVPVQQQRVGRSAQPVTVYVMD